MASEQFNPLRDLRTHLSKQNACDVHPPLRRSESIEEAELWRCTIENCAPAARHEHLRWLGLNDLFFFAVFILHRWHLIGDKLPFDPAEDDAARKKRHEARDWRRAKWCFERATEVFDDPFGWIDLWPREHAKSEIVTFAKNIQDALIDSNETIGMFSHSRPISKAFLRQIKTELTINEDLKELYPDRLYANPEKESPKWSEDDGLVIKRTSNLKESTFEAWGLIDGQPTSKRYSILSYDDIISRKEVSEFMTLKAVEEFENSLFLKAGPLRFRYCATFQEIGDPTQRLIDRGYKVRQRNAFDETGQPAFMSPEEIADLKQKMSAKTFALQILLDPKAARAEQHLGFSEDWLEYYEKAQLNLDSVNRFILVDPAGASKETNSHFALGVVGLAPDRRYKLLDAVVDKLNLKQRTDALKERVLAFRPLCIFYEKQAFQSDIEHIRGEMRRELWECEIIEVGTNQLTKDQRIEALIPVFQNKLFQLPREGIPYRAVNIEDGREIDVVKWFIEREYKKWPFGSFKDLLDMLAWLKWQPIANKLVWPRRYGDTETLTGPFGIGDGGDTGGWMSQ